MKTTRDIFAPANTHEWGSLVRPPAGYRLAGAIGTTFCLDFTALTAVLLGCLDQTATSRTWDERTHLLHAVTQIGDRVRVLVNRGQIKASVRPSNKLFALFDDLIDEVCLPKSSFHPKVWILKFAPITPLGAADAADRRVGASEAVYRLICTSRNLTLASTWEAVVCLEGHFSPKVNSEDLRGSQVADFFKACTKKSNLPRPLAALLQELPKVSFPLNGNSAVNSADFLWQAPGAVSLSDQLTPGGTVALIVSPFIGASFIETLATRFKRVIVISRQSELDAHQEAVLASAASSDIWVVKSPDLGEQFEGTLGLDLHAKLLFTEYPVRKGSERRTEAWLGSANASGRAWGLGEFSDRINCEAMVRFRPAVAPEVFFEQFAGKDGDWNGWIEPYTPRPVEDMTHEERADHLLEAAAKDFAALELRAHLSFDADQANLSIDTPDIAGWEAAFATHPEVTCDICPLASASDHDFQPLRQLSEGPILFAGLPIAALGAFILIRFTHSQTKRTLTRAVKVTLSELPRDFAERRRTAFLKANLSARDFGLFLKCILTGAQLPSESTGTQEPTSHKPGIADTTYRRSFDELTIEDVMDACTRDSSLVEVVDQLVLTFKQAGHIDQAFEIFWQAFRSALKVAPGRATS